MAYEVRDLDEHCKKLRHGVCLVTCSFMKSFARRPAYWLEIYKVPTKKHSSYIVARQWSFIRDGETVEGETLSAAYFSLNQATDHLAKLAQKKLEDNWIFHEPAIVPSTVQGSDLQLIRNLLSAVGTFINAQTLGTSATVKATTKSPDPKTRAERFEAARKKRQAKAEW